jgi:acyl carrier protein
MSNAQNGMEVAASGCFLSAQDGGSKERTRQRRWRSMDKLKGAFATVLGVDLNGDFESMAYGQTPGWDSVAHMALIAEIEAAFDIMLPTDDVIGMSSFAKAKEIVVRNGADFA